MYDMYESAPTEREGERIDKLVSEAISATANATASDSGRRTGARGARPANNEKEKRLTVIAIGEGVVILAMLVTWIL